MKTIAITNIKLQDGITHLDAIRHFRNNLKLTVTDSKNLVDELLSVETWKIIFKSTENEYKFYIISDIFTFDIVKDAYELEDEKQLIDMQKLQTAAQEWYESLSEENRMFVDILKSNMIPQG